MKFEKTYHLPVPVASVFAAWVSPEAVVSPVTSIKIEPRVGGVFHLCVGTGANKSVMDGQILEYEQNQHIRYTWSWGGEDPPSIVDVTFTDVDGATALLIVHSEIETQDLVAQFASGWDDYIIGLSALLSRT